MRTNELVEALAQAEGGVQINVSRSGATVSTRYTPLVKGRGANVYAAARSCASNLLGHIGSHPDHAEYCPDVLKALDAYDKHTRFLQV
jgi:hypothetical protein